jgi:Right handed beta helix region
MLWTTRVLWSGMGMLGGLLSVASIAAAQVSADVDCGSGNTLARALLEAQPGDTLRIAGTCSEFVTLTIDRLTLDGLGSAILDAGGEGAAVINIEGAQGVVIRGLTVRNSTDGILIQRAAAVTLDNVASEDNIDTGFQVDENATVRMSNSTSQRNGDNGIEVRRSANVTLQGSIISNNNGFHGISIFDSASVVLNNARGTVTGNAINGVQVSSVSGLAIENSSDLTTNSNANDGIAISTSSSLRVSPGSSITASQNGRNGIFILNASSMQSFGTINTTGNTSAGFVAARNSTMEIGDGGALTSTNNDVGLLITNLSVGATFGNASLTLRNNVTQDCSVSENSDWDANATGPVDIGTQTGCPPSQSNSVFSILGHTEGFGIPAGQ